MPSGRTVGMLVTAADVVDEGNDAARLVPMVNIAEEVTGVKTPMTIADAGHFSGDHVAELQRRGQQVAMPDRARPKGRPYHKGQFTYDESDDSYICAHGQKLSFARSRTKGQVHASHYPSLLSVLALQRQLEPHREWRRLARQPTSRSRRDSRRGPGRQRHGRGCRPPSRVREGEGHGPGHEDLPCEFTPGRS